MNEHCLYLHSQRKGKHHSLVTIYIKILQNHLKGKIYGHRGEMSRIFINAINGSNAATVTFAEDLADNITHKRLRAFH